MRRRAAAFQSFLRHFSTPSHACGAPADARIGCAAYTTRRTSIDRTSPPGARPFSGAARSNAKHRREACSKGLKSTPKHVSQRHEGLSAVRSFMYQLVQSCWHRQIWTPADTKQNVEPEYGHPLESMDTHDKNSGCPGFSLGVHAFQPFSFCVLKSVLSVIRPNVSRLGP